MRKNKTYRKISWQEVEMSVDLLAEKIKKEFDLKNIQGIVGIERGGIVPAIMLSHLLDIEYFAYTDMSHPYNDNRKYIIVDDIADTGRTLGTFVWESDIMSSLYFREHTCCKKVKDNLIFAKKINNDDWLIFPWELRQSDITVIQVPEN